MYQYYKNLKIQIMKHTTSFQCTVIKQTVKSVNITNAIDFNFFGKQCYDFVIDDESMNNP